MKPHLPPPPGVSPAHRRYGQPHVNQGTPVWSGAFCTMRGSQYLIPSLLSTGDLMRNPCQFHLSSTIRHSAFIATAIAAIACSEATAPVIPAKYLVTTFNSTAAAGDTLVVKAQLADDNDHSVAISGKHVGWYIGDGHGQFTSNMTLTDADGVATNHFVVGEKAN